MISYQAGCGEQRRSRLVFCAMGKIVLGAHGRNARVLFSVAFLDSVVSCVQRSFVQRYELGTILVTEHLGHCALYQFE
jgi:hypothetical protein